MSAARNPKPLGERPSRLPHANLAGAFGGTGPGERSAGLAGRLAPRSSGPRPAGPPQPETVEAQPAADLLEAPVPPAPSAREGRPRRRREPQREAPGQAPLQTVIVYLPASLREQLRAAASQRRTTHTEVALAALDATHPRLPELLAPQQQATQGTSLFSARPVTRRPRHDEPHVQVSLRLTTGDLEVIDQLTAQTSAPNRSALVSTALRVYLASS